MKRSIWFCLLVIASLQGQGLVTLQTYFTDDYNSLSSQFSSFDCVIDSQGALWTITSITREGWYPSYYVHRYAEGMAGNETSVGTFWGMGGWFSPNLIRAGASTIQVQTHEVDDVLGIPHHYELATIDFSQSDPKRRQYPGGSIYSYLGPIWKTSDSTASSFVSYQNWMAGTEYVFFLKNYRLYDETWISDEDTVFTGDTLWTSQGSEILGDTEILPSTRAVAAIMGYWDSNALSFVCLLEDSVVYEDTLFNQGARRVSLHGVNDQFEITWIPTGTDDIWSMTFNPGTAQFSAPELIYLHEQGSLLSTTWHRIVAAEDAIYVQMPIKHDLSSTEHSNWASIALLTISRENFQVTHTDTLIQFGTPQHYVSHRLTVAEGIPHSLIAAYDGVDISRIYYHGPLDLVNLDPRWMQPDHHDVTRVYPNPFNAQLKIEFTLHEGSNVRLNVYDLNGRLVDRVENAWLPAGHHKLSWRATHQPSGVYFLEFQNGKQRSTHKLMLIK